MRKLLLLRGLPGSGKSTFIRENDLEPFTLAADTLRMAYGGPVYEATGGRRIPADNDRRVWQQLLELLEKRMFRGELVIIDATHSHPRSFSNYMSLAKKQRYQVFCVDFADVPFEICMERNSARPDYYVVPPLEMGRMRDNLQRTVLPKWLTVLKPAELLPSLQIEPTDVSKYKKIHHIGDIQGCYDPLAAYFDKYGMHDDELYIFVGDYVDRGTQNAAVMKWLLDNYHRPNLIFLEGNHEAHLRNWANGAPARSREFNLATKPQLEAAGIAPKKVHGFLYKTREMFYYTFHGRTVLVTHGGLSTLPEYIATVASIQLIKGVGAYEEATVADEHFAMHAPPETYQIHGHRNRESSPTRVNERCFNLEGKVEFGGELRTVTLTPEGFEERPIKSVIDASATIIDAVGDIPGASSENVANLLQLLRTNKDIYEKPQEGTHISSFNFKRDVFYKKSWNEFNVHARGLFINTNHEVIVARAYEKFFNVGERPETQPDALQRSFVFPVTVWLKENGYLGLIGYDPESDELVFASKSSLTSEFAGWLKDHFEAMIPSPERREAIKQYLQSDGGKTLVFEVIDPHKDPHIIEYAEPQLVLLDIVANKVAFEAMGEEERRRVADMLSCPVKQRAVILKDQNALHDWLAKVNDFEFTWQGQPIEGFVLEDARGFMTKVKLPWYAFWRQMRTQLENVRLGRKAKLPALDINNELARSFLRFMETKDSEHLKNTSLVALRREFESAEESAKSAMIGSAAP